MRHVFYSELFPGVAWPSELPAARPRGGVRAPIAGGLSPAAMVETARGPVAAGALGAGDRVLTLEAGFVPLIWAGRHRAPPGCAGARSGAVRIAPRPGADGRALEVAESQLILLEHELNEPLFGQPRVLARAGDLAGLYRLTRPRGAQRPAWVHLLLPALGLVRADGHWVESMAPDPARLLRDAPALAREVAAAEPRLRFAAGAASYARALPVLERREIDMLLQVRRAGRGEAACDNACAPPLRLGFTG